MKEHTSSLNTPEASRHQKVSAEHLLLPDMNPNPIMVLDKVFGFVYRNVAAEKLSQELDLDGYRDLLPSDLMENWPPNDMVQTISVLPGERLLFWSVVQLSDDMWGCYGTDISDFTRYEEALQQHKV